MHIKTECYHKGNDKEKGFLFRYSLVLYQ